MSHALGVRRVDLYLSPGTPVGARGAARARRLLAQKAAGFPVQYLTGRVSFYGLDFRLARGVFIPRPETEFVVETVLRLVNRHGGCPAVLDVGCGCGAIGLAVARLSRARVVLLDKSARAVKTAEANRRRLGLDSARARVIRSPLALFACSPAERFGIVVSNPPYIPVGERNALAAEVRREPPAALFAGVDGLSFIRRLVRRAGDLVAPGGALVFEAGRGQRAGIAEILAAGGLDFEGSVRDYGGVDRVMIARRSPRGD